MRITKQSKFRERGSRRAVTVTDLAPQPGCRWQGRGTAFPRHAERRLDCTLMACWEEGYEEPWFLVTDLAPEEAEALWYGMRSWIEGGYKLLKSGGWEWQATRMTDPGRAERLWLVLAVATLYVVAIGGEADEAEFADATAPEPADQSARSNPGRRPARGGRRRTGDAAERPVRAREPRRRPSGTKRRLVGIFAQGLAVLVSLLVGGHELPRPSWRPEAWLEIRAEVGQPRSSPRRRSRKTPPSEPPPALKGRYTGMARRERGCLALTGLGRGVRPVCPGRCPGLECLAPSGPTGPTGRGQLGRQGGPGERPRAGSGQQPRPAA